MLIEKFYQKTFKVTSSSDASLGVTWFNDFQSVERKLSETSVRRVMRKSKRKMIGKVSKRFMIAYFLVLSIAQMTSAIGFNDCLKHDKNDNKIRIGFLSRYKTSKVSWKTFFTHMSGRMLSTPNLCKISFGILLIYMKNLVGY